MPIPTTIRELLRNEERAGNLVIWGSGAVAGLCLAAVVLAMALMK